MQDESGVSIPFDAIKSRNEHGFRHWSHVSIPFDAIKSLICGDANAQAFVFQFHLMRLKDIYSDGYRFGFYVSIPFDAIKRRTS